MGSELSHEHAHIGAVLSGMGYSIDAGSLRDTPKRFLAWLSEFREGQELDSVMTTFDGVASSYDEMIVVRGIPFVSLCEHHLLPFIGTVTVGYIPDKGNGLVLGLSKLARIAVWRAKRLQVQERLTVEIRDAVALATQSDDVGVVISAVHTCMTLRGVRAGGSETVTSSLRGAYKTDGVTRAEFMALAKA